MSRRIETGNVRSMTSTRTVTWNRGRRTVVKSYTQVNRKTGELSRVTHVSSFNLLGIVFLIVLFASIASILSSAGGPITFASFLEMLTTVPNLSMPWLEFSSFVLNLPDWLSWLMPLWNLLQGAIGVVLFLIGGIIQCITMVIWVMRWLFL